MLRRLTILVTVLVGLSPVSAFAEAEPIDIVRSLYAGHPYEIAPPGGMDLWTPRMQAIWQKLNEDEAQRVSGELEYYGEGLTVDFMTGTQEFWFDDLKVKTVDQTAGTADVLAVMNNGADAPFALHYDFVRDEAGDWQIAEVRRDAGWLLSERIQATR